MLDYSLVIIDSDGNSHLIDTNRYWKILTLKNEFSKYLLSTINACWITQWKILDNEKLIIDYKMNENDVILAICSTKGVAVLQLVTWLRCVDDHGNNSNKKSICNKSCCDYARQIIYDFHSPNEYVGNQQNNDVRCDDH